DQGPEWRIYDAEGPAGMVNKLIDRGGGYYDLLLGDGGKVLFGPPRPNVVSYSFFAYAIVDPYGQITTLDHDGSGKLTRVTEPGGRYLQINYQTFSYYDSAMGVWHYEDVISAVQAFDGRGNLVETVSYGYDTVWVGYFFPRQCYYLTHVYYGDGSQAAYTYERTN